ncbi:MAG: branched-chain amino acid ABC transporter permease, partial [Chloroflexi bacterium]|nr:branched-chain amino acid ABC transporter permease [Chloroflexota bacterium]
FSEAIRLLINNTYKVAGIPIGGSYGYMGIPQITDVSVIIVAVGLSMFVAHQFVTSQYGKNCVAIREDEVAAEMMGINLLKTKLLSLFISAFFAGVAGGLLGFYMAYLTPSFFGISRSSDLLAAIVFGGIQSLIGPAITAFILVAVPELLRFFAEWRLILYGLLFVIVMVFRPQGLLGYREMNFAFVQKGWQWLHSKLQKQEKKHE